MFLDVIFDFVENKTDTNCSWPVSRSQVTIAGDVLVGEDSHQASPLTGYWSMIWSIANRSAAYC